MKKIIFISFFLLFSVTFLYAVNAKDITLIVQGSGSPSFVEGFKYALTVEAKAAGYQMTDNLSQAKYNINFTVEFDRVEQKSKFIVSLIKVDDSSVIVSMEYFFADEEEMMLYAQLVFFLLMSNLPEDVTTAAPEDDTWRNKWLYLNTSFDYSIMLLLLNDPKLYAGNGVYFGTPGDANFRVAPLDHKFIFMPGVSLGLELQFLNFLSIEPRAQISREQALLDHIMYTALFSVDLKIPLKFLKYIVIEPYVSAAYPMRFPVEKEVFKKYPLYFFGGGIQIAAKAGKSGALFFEANYMFDADYLFFGKTDTSMKNPFEDFYPEPEVIHYNHSVLGFRIGYKFGFFNRKP